MANEYRWAFGTLSLAALTTTYAVSAFPRATDQPPIFDWQFDLAEADLFLADAEMVDALDGSRGGFGDGAFTWTSGPLSPGMLDWLRTNRFNGGDKSALATVMTPDRSSLSSAWRVVNCLVLWPNLAKDADMAGDGFNRVKFAFVKAVAAT